MANGTFERFEALASQQIGSRHWAWITTMAEAASNAGHRDVDNSARIFLRGDRRPTPRFEIFLRKRSRSADQAPPCSP